ncbi:MAG TPA: type III-A CRISPR-associated RAMP protein Csm3, partial [Chitinophagales bacterium]|nr:type III-A CRISPR-associated RAMP protein Csm3 [Chitinophagales bacterium]
GSFADYDLELGYTEVKFENTIDRRNGGAIPRQLERVPEDVCFQMKLVYDVYDDNKTDAHIKQILLAMRLLEEDYLGGQGSRGYGRISFDDVEIKRSTIVNNMLGAEEDTNHTYTGNPNPNHGE